MKFTKRILILVLCFCAVLCGLCFSASADTSSPIELQRLGGSGNASIYHSFQETPSFNAGGTYAFLNGKYSSNDAVSDLGAGAILEALATAPDHGGKYDTEYYVQKKYGDTAEVKTYVKVITPGKDFDNCPYGGLYQVPNTSNPTAYRYFCWKGGAYNCGPYYAYTYTEEKITYDKVSASLKFIENQGSINPEDYTVSITYNGNQIKTLDSGSYTVKFTEPNTVTFVISDSVGNSVTANFESPLAIRYDGNVENVSNIPATQSVWKGNSTPISTQTPTRSGYTFNGWKDKTTDKTYSSGASVTPTTSLNLLAQWKDSTPPTVVYSPTQVMTGDSDTEVKAAVQAALTITDNESDPSDCIVTITVPTDFTKTPGNKNVTVTVKDKAGNTTTKTCTVYVSSYVKIGEPTFTESSNKLTATLINPGTDTVTESGFVWGVMNSPTISVNNGSATTSSVVQTANTQMTVTAIDLQKGVTYYARAYITTGGITYYSEEISFGLGLPAYGTFTIKNNGNKTFTVTRSGGSEGAQTVYYRTVNGSAVGGTHFTHQASTLTFAAGETSKTITVTENTANTAYSGKPATAYSNADRTYSVEIYRVTGGGSLGTTASATRTMANNNSYKVNKNEYGNDNERTVSLSDSNKWVSDKSGGGDWEIVFQNNRGKNTNQMNFNVQRSIDNPYLKATASGFLYRAIFSYREDNDGYQLAWVANQNPSSYGPVKINITTAIPTSSTFGTAKFTATWETNNEKEAKLWFPDMTGNEIKKITATNKSCETGTANGSKSILFGADETAYVWFSAAGDGEDKWYMTEFTDFVYVQDTVEPQLVAVAPMAGGTYKIGDKFVVSLIFDEIVDSTNSTLSNVSVNTTWGTAYYCEDGKTVGGGENTNVLYFTGTVANNASGKLTVNSISGTSYIKDMCNSTTTEGTASGAGATTATVDTGTPSFTVTSNGITNGTGKATIKVTGTQSKTTGMSYAWSDSAAVPTSGWVTLTSTELTSAKSTSGLTLSIRKEAGSGKSNGKWYLHVKGVYDTTGCTVYQTATLDFGTAASPASGSTKPTLTVTVDNTNWATSRTITITAKGGGTLKYRKEGVNTWTDLSTNASNYSSTKSVIENGYYTFLLTAGDETITKTVEVKNIDRKNPTASIGELTSASVETQKSGVYTKLVLPITYADADSGVSTVYYNWTNSANTPMLSSGYTSVTIFTYDATTAETTPTTKYLHVKVVDKVGNSYTTCSGPYTVINATAVKNHTPTITLKGAPTAWQNDTATLTWELFDYSGKNYEVVLPDGRTSKEPSGEIWARQNEKYTVTVRDLDYGGENSDTVTVDKLDFTSPAVTLSGISSAWSNSGSQTLTLTASDAQSGLGDKYYKIVENNEEIPTTELMELAGNTITVSNEGEYYIYYKVYDKSGNDSDDVKREANYTEGFQLVQIDRTAPTITFGDYSESAGMSVTVSDSISKLASVTYKIGSGSATSVESVKGEAEGSFTVNNISAGNNTITVTAIDNAGNSFTGSTEIHKHNMTYHEAANATCVSAGMKAYYQCSVCSKLFDENKAETNGEALKIEVDDNAHSYGTPEYNWTNYAACTGTITCSYNAEHKITENAVITSTVTKEPTCTETGIKTYTAKFSNENFSEQSKEESIPAKGHTEVIDAAVAATCAKTGLTEGKHCSVCNAVIVAQTEIEKLAHTPNVEVEENVVAATCTTAGSYDEVVYCSVCNEKISSEEKTIPALEHSWATVFTIDKEATCTEKGSKSQHCTRSSCDAKIAVTEISASGHDYSVSLNNGVEPTCTTEGKETDMKCSRCDDVKTGGTINALGHSMTHYDEVAATCTAKGNVEYWSCSRCNKYFSDQTGNTELNTVTTEENSNKHSGTLSAWKSNSSGHWKEYSCCHVKTDGTGHNFGTWSGGKQICDVCNYENTCNHTGGEATCTKKAVCTNCGAEYGDYAAHVYSSQFFYDDGGHWHKCQNCNAAGTQLNHTFGEWSGGQQTCTACGYENTCNHTGGTATCTEKAVCTNCGAEYGDYAAHDYANTWLSDAGGHWHKCQNCDATDTKQNHTFGEWSDSQKTCSTCNYVETCTEHKWDSGIVTKQPTCTEAGEKTFTCSECGGTKTEPMSALGHDEVSHEAKAATCKEIGWNAYVTCSRCSYTTYEGIGALGHTGGTATCIQKAQCERCEEEYGELGAHTWQSANCTTPKTCSLCLETEGAELGHNWETGFTVDTQPSCTTAGSKSKHCSRCDEVKEVTAIAALGHDWGRYTVTKAATTENEGVETRTCTRDSSHTQTRIIAKLTPVPIPTSTYDITGEVVDSENKKLSGASVSLVLGDRQIARATTDEDGKYGFGDIEPGVYNLVTSYGDVTMTVKVQITSSDVNVDTITMPAGRTSTVVEVNSDIEGESVEAVVGNLDTIFTDDKASEVYTKENKEIATTDGGSVEIKLIVDKKAEEKIDEKITEVLKTDTRNNVGMHLDIKVEKTVTQSGGEAEVTPINDTGVLLETVIKLPTQLQGKQSYTVYRLHGNEVQALTTAKNEAGEYIEISSDRKSLTIHAKYYSEYVIAYQEKSSSSGGGHTAAYQVITPVQPKEGGILVSPKTAEYGETVTVTLKPEEGYEADTVTVLDKDGKAIEITDKGDGTYTFKMPIGNVTVSATFKKAADKGKDYADCPKDATCPIDKFTDAENAAWYHDGVHYCLENGLMKGMSSTEFLPDGDVTRAQIVTILWRIEGSKVVNYAMKFKDVEDGSWYAEAIRWAASEDVVTGYSAEAFGPNDSVTREQLATILYRYAKYKGMDVTGKVAELDKFSDGASVSAYALPAMKWAVGSQIINGTTVTKLSPKGTATRAQAASLMQRFLTGNR